MSVVKGRVGRTSPMGASLMTDGTGFRTWAPNATAVFVVAGAALEPTLAQEGWQPASDDAMEPLGDGTWGGLLLSIKEGDPYLFYVEGAGGSGWKRDPFARELSFAPAYPASWCLVRDPATYPWHDSAWQPPALRELIVYQLHVGTWWAQDEQGNDVRGMRSGTFLDVVAKLDYLIDLGINAIQLLPIQEFETGYSLGYNGTDPYSPEIPYCVSPDDLRWRLAEINAMLASSGQPALTETDLTPGINQLKCLIDLCHLKGLAVILDQVYNHAFGHDSRGTFDPRSLWFYDCQQGPDPNRSLYFTDQTWIGPIFAYWQDGVCQFLIDNARFYLVEYHVDGLRYDEVSAIVNHGGETFAQHLSETARATRRSAVQIAEYWNGDRPRAIEPPPGGLGFDAELADGLRDSVRALLKQASYGLSASLDLSAVAGALTATPVEAWRLNTCLENHDLTYAGHDGAARLPFLADSTDRRSWYARSRVRSAATLLLCAPGVPLLFMGQECLEDKNWSDDRSANGLIYWAGLTAADSSMRDFLRCSTELVHLRLALPALCSTSVRVSRANDFDRVLVMHRWIEGVGGDVIVVVSFDELPKRAYQIGLPMAGTWREVFNSDVYDGYPNPAPVGNGGSVEASGPPLDGFVASAWLAVPATGSLIFVRG
ncbi:alpha amylase C-terminal domain-containing protein [Paraburkholderia sp. CI3]|uniref:alpha amylase C-terminal domain-containing protein n=1 Tax=Paraburkholderia sp. CI3 TaxID=2991060 RepID=UPI003D210D15